MKRQQKFQPTPAHGGRLCRGREQAKRRPVSTHARARRATSSPSSSGENWPSFNPRPRTAGDSVEAESRQSGAQFQPTPAHGGRLHPHRRLAKIGRVSTHARARRATARPRPSGRELPVSTHARARRATNRSRTMSPGRLVSTHARARRATARWSGSAVGTGSFNPRPRTAGDSFARLISVLPHVSTHARARRAT